MLALIALTAGFAVQDPATAPLDRRIDVVMRATSMANVVARLGRETGLNLRTSTATADDVVVVHAQGVTARALLDRLATAAQARWESDGSTLRLVPDVAARQRDLRQRREAAARRFALPPAPEDGPDAEEPSRIAQRRIASAIPIDAWMDAESEGRIVFAANPTPRQRPLPPMDPRWIGAIVDAHNRAAAERQARAPERATPPDAEPDAEAADGSEAQAMMEAFAPGIRAMEEMGRTPLAAVGRVLIVLERPPAGIGFFDGGGDVSARLDIYAADGRRAITRDLPTPGEDRPMSAPTAPDAESADAGEIPPASVAVEPSPETTRLTEQTDASMEGAPRLADRVSPELRDQIRRPTTWDPLAYGATDAAFALARQVGRPLVAVLPDSAFGDDGSPPSPIQATPNGFPGLVRVGEAEEWWVLRPADPEAARRTRIPRLALEAFLAAAEAGDGGLPLAALNRLAAALPEQPHADLLNFYVWNLAGGFGFDSIQGRPWEVHRFHGALGEAMRSSLASGAVATVGGLPPAARRALDRLVYGPDRRVRVERAAPKMLLDDPFVGIMAEAMGQSFPIDRQDEPTEAFGAGLPPQAEVRLRLDSEDYFSAVVDRGRTAPFYRSMGALEYSLFDLMRAQPEMADESIPVVERLRVGRRTRHHLEIRLSPVHRITATLTDDAPLGNSPVVTPATLPADVRDRLNARRAALEKSMLFRMGMTGGLGSPTRERP